MHEITRDPISGYTTTGHNWNGILELNSPVPKPVYFFIFVTHLYALVAWFLLPAWPLGDTYTKGLWGVDQKTTLEASLVKANTARADWVQAFATDDFDTIRANDELMARGRATAATLFGDNCQACHGAGGKGGPGFPRLNDDIWLWGGSAEEIATTIEVGINSADPDTHFAQMPAFGRDGMLTRPQIAEMADYVLTLSGGVKPGDTSDAATLFQDNCSSCHGEDAKGVEGTGAPNLTDDDWIYGSNRDTILATLMNGRQGHMPTWKPRLSVSDIRMLALYVEGLHSAAAEASQ
ncbi:cytochrome-c oxidase, cbb3-type subunit III [Pseudorhodobacter sp.]|uniref:cytochrome-c oxidase, cbb3-type subunit III n=1 Tax=Pseudorhodobacter sp. TaxID=1934400 RepID=UPI0026497A7B|nr:cytochrome-c oxidase, cbb3-type subunit III [Pseudorhodobacter sp.]MDN5785609.1 cytochrome-c oxidase, cbb3-type subunit III [Pseudorhodobacter sp.]